MRVNALANLALKYLHAPEERIVDRRDPVQPGGRDSQQAKAKQQAAESGKYGGGAPAPGKIGVQQSLSRPVRLAAAPESCELL